MNRKLVLFKILSYNIYIFLGVTKGYFNVLVYIILYLIVPELVGTGGFKVAIDVRDLNDDIGANAYPVQYRF